MTEIYCKDNNGQIEDNEEAVVEVEDENEEGNNDTKDTLHSVDLKSTISKALKSNKRYNEMKKIPAGTFTMGTDELITKDGETPARK